MIAKPFMKWIGGKRQLLPEILKRFPTEYGAYHEPFVGGGAVFFALQPKEAHLSDMNGELVKTYLAVQQDIQGLRWSLDQLKNRQSQEDYYAIRARDPAEMAVVPTAARFIYLNKCGFNGLYRVNSKGGFNTPWGKRTDVALYDPENLAACAEALQRATVERRSFETVLDRAKAGDLVYFDPPYVPVSKTSNFTKYTKDGFTWNDQVRLRNTAEWLRERGCHVVLSNAGLPCVRELYSDWRCDEVSARRAINSDATKRGGVSEFLIW